MGLKIGFRLIQLQSIPTFVDEEGLDPGVAHHEQFFTAISDIQVNAVDLFGGG